MTYHSRGRSIAKVIAAAIFVGFLTGFVAVLCIGNYFRAKRAMERQKQRRLARLAGGGGNGVGTAHLSGFATRGIGHCYHGREHDRQARRFSVPGPLRHSSYWYCRVRRLCP